MSETCNGPRPTVCEAASATAACAGSNWTVSGAEEAVGVPFASSALTVNVYVWPGATRNEASVRSVEASRIRSRPSSRVSRTRKESPRGPVHVRRTRSLTRTPESSTLWIGPPAARATAAATSITP